MIEVYKLLTGKEQIDYKQFFRLAENHYGVRGHTRKLFFSQRVVNSNGTVFQQKS